MSDFKSRGHVTIMAYNKKKALVLYPNHTAAGAAHVSHRMREESSINTRASDETLLQRAAGRATCGEAKRLFGAQHSPVVRGR